MLPNNMTAKQCVMEQLIFSLSVPQRIAIERAIADTGANRARASMAITQSLVRHSKPRNADMVKAILPLLRQDCLQAVATI